MKSVDERLEQRDRREREAAAVRANLRQAEALEEIATRLERIETAIAMLNDG